MKNNFDVFTNKFAYDIFKQKYSLDGIETWADTCRRVVDAVCSQLVDNKAKEKIFQYMLERKFIPGGRYLASAGRKIHYINNCYLFRAEDSSEGWADLMQKSTAALLSGGGIGTNYNSIRAEGEKILGKGGTSTGPISLMKMINEAGRYIMQGGQRRSAIFASLSWKHKDIFKFLEVKNHSQELRDLKSKNLNFPLPMELTNISVDYDTEFFIAIENENHELHEHAKKVWMQNCRQAFSTAEPGFMFNFMKDNENLRNACVLGDTEILTKRGYERIDSLVGEQIEIWNGFEWSKVIPKITGKNQEMLKITFSDGRKLTCTKYHTFHIVTNYLGDSIKVKAEDLKPKMKLIKHKFPIIQHGIFFENAYAQGFISAEGMNDYSYCTVYEPKEMCIFRLKGKASKKESKYKKTRVSFNFEIKPKSFVPFEWDLTSKLNWLAGLFDGDGTELKEGGLQLVSVDREFLNNVQTLLSTLGVQSKINLMSKAAYKLMPDGKGGEKEYFCQDSYRICIGAVQMQDLKSLGLKCERLSFNKYPQRDASQFVSVVSVEEAGIADNVYCFNEPNRHLGIFNGIITGQCTEITSEDDSDKCNLGTIWLNRVKDKKELAEICKYATLFLLCGGIYSDTPTSKIREVGSKNNRIGLGLGGVHEWLLMRGYDYNVVPELHKWLSIYEQESDAHAFTWAKQLNVPSPKGKRAIAPVGTIGILAETTTSCEPLFCASYKRRYFKEGKWLYQYVVDGTVKRLIEKGIKIESIEDSYDLSFKQRVKFQADVQNYVDMAISSTCNVPKWGSEKNCEATLEQNSKTLLKYAKRLRGFTVYPDGCRDGQPLERVPLKEALENEGTVFEETENTCVNGICGI